MSKPTPPLHPDNRFDDSVLDTAIELLRASREPRSPLVPDERAVTALPQDFTDTGIGEVEALRLLAPAVLHQSAQLHHPGYFAHMDPPTPAITWATGLWQAASNQNVLHPDCAPAARVLQNRVIDWLSPYFGMTGGHFTAGATLANFTAMWAARECAGIRRVVCSNRSHLSIKKSADILGLDCQMVDADDGHSLNPDKLPNVADAMLIATAGTVATGAIDPLTINCAWLHVDAAWAGPLRFSALYSERLAGIEQADSVGVSAHKWLFQPKGSALVFFKDAERAHEKLSYGGGYLAAPNIGVLGSAPAPALPLAASLIAWGKEGLQDRIELTMSKADQLKRLIDMDDRFECWGANVSGVIVWRAKHRDSRELRDRIENAWVSLVDIDGECWLRSVAANPSADPQWVFDCVCDAL